MPAPRTAPIKTRPPSESAEDPLRRVRDQLCDMQKELAGRLAKEFSGGDMTLLSSVTGALAGVEAELARRRG
jgi:hypothetical protein